MTVLDLAAFRTNDIRNCSTDGLVDLQAITINPAQPVRERFSSFMEKINNPYLFKVGGIAVAIRYVGEKTLFNSLLDSLSLQ